MLKVFKLLTTICMGLALTIATYSFVIALIKKDTHYLLMSGMFVILLVASLMMYKAAKAILFPYDDDDQYIDKKI